jgi:hypothetical protein
MKKENQSIHGLTDGTGLFWSLRSLIKPSRDITLNPEQGVFVAEADTAESMVRTQQEQSPKHVPHHTYRIGGQLAQIYTQTLGREFAILA